MPSATKYALIMAGGRGTRFWPRSRRRRAKQVLPLFGERTLIQQTVDRLARVLTPERMWVITNELLRDEIVRQLPEIPRSQILAEPAARNTAPCIGVMAHILDSLDPTAVLGVFPADHIVARPREFAVLVRAAYQTAAAGKIVVLGVRPRWAETGFGYIEFPPGVEPGALTPYPVLRFREKPDAATAEDYLRQGRFYWNAGMFFWRAGVLLDQLRRHLPATARVIDALPPFSSRRFRAAFAARFAECENISIDYAVLEKADGVVGFAAGDIGWDDMGSWKAVYELAAKDEQGNALETEALALGAHRNLVSAPGKLVALLDVDDLVIVDTPDALLVARRDSAQKVSHIVARLEQQRRDDLL